MQGKTSSPILDENWRFKYKGVTNRFKSILLENSLLWDIGFQVGSTVFKAHKLVLAIGSPVFETMFYSEQGESEYIISISDVDSTGFQHLLSYIYSGCVSFNHISEAVSTSKAADIYDVPELKDQCDIFLAEQDYKPSTVWPVLENAESIDLPLTKKKAWEIVRRNTREALKTEGFFSSGFRVIQTLLGLNDVSVPEIQLLDSLACWVKRKSGYNISSSQSAFKALVPYIRFKAIKPDEICAFMEKHPEFLNDHESTLILRHMVKPDSNYLPAWCNRQRPRKNSVQSEKTFAQKLWSTLKNPQLF